jgi:hypothetical protein
MGKLRCGECLLPFSSESFYLPVCCPKTNIDVYRTTSLLAVLCGFRTWFFILNENHILRVFENRVLREIFAPNREEVTGDCRKLHNEELHNLYSAPNIIIMIKSRRLRWAGHVAHREKRSAYKILVEKPERKRPLGIPNHK